MRAKRLTLYAGIVGVALVLVWLLGVRKVHRPLRPVAAELIGSTARLEATKERQLTAGGGSGGRSPQVTTTTSSAYTKPLLSGNLLSALNNERVVLYGVAKDQFGRPVPGATVSASVQVNSGVRVGNDRFSLVTADDGTFTISGYNGKALGVHLSKPGYVMATTNTRFVYSLLWPAEQRHVPDPKMPVVFEMWRRRGSQPLVRIDQKYALAETYAPLIFDLLAGKMTISGGDLRVAINIPSGDVSSRHMQDWGLSIEAVRGGVIETSFAQARVTYEAPETDYQPDWRTAVSATNHWSGGVQRMFFLKTRDGEVYSKIFVSFGIKRGPGRPAWLTFEGWASTNGSRNWEATAQE